MNNINGLLTGSFTLLLWTLVIFGLGMYKPKWPLFFLEKPTRFMILGITLVLFMITATLFGEGNRRAKLEEAAKHKTTEITAPAPAPEPVPVPVPAPAPEKPAK